MKKFIPRFQGAPWRDGMHVLHAYLLPKLTTHQDLAALVSACRRAIHQYPVALLDDDRLHTTIEMVADTTGENITRAEREELTDALHEHLANTAPFQVTAGAAIVNPAGAVLDLSADDPLADLTGRVRDALCEARGPSVLQHDGGRHHMALGYGNPRELQ